MFDEILYEVQDGSCTVDLAAEIHDLAAVRAGRPRGRRGGAHRRAAGSRLAARHLLHRQPRRLTQMAGRAGRRGIDPEGTCVVALDARDGLEGLAPVPVTRRRARDL
jgi:hypothetical protein